MTKKSNIAHNQNNHVIASTQTVTHYEGAIPHPEILKGFNDLVPGTAEKLIRLAEEESAHRRSLEIASMNSNINVQQHQMDMDIQQNKAVFKSDMIGQISGLIVCLASIGTAAYLGINGHDWLAGGISAIPTATLIKAFFLNKK